MKSTCKTISRAIIECNGDFSPIIESHCRECASCRALMEDWCLLRNIPLPEPTVPKTSDEIIIAAAQRLSEKSRLRSFLRRAAIFAAAAGIIIGGVWLFIALDSLPFHATAPKSEHVAEMNWESFEKWLFESDTNLLLGKELLAIDSNNEYNPEFYFNYDYLF